MLRAQCLDDIHLPQEALPVRIIIMRAADSGTSLEGQRPPSEDAYNWSKFSLFPVMRCNVPGNHFTMLAKPYLYVIADRLLECLSPFDDKKKDVQ